MCVSWLLKCWLCCLSYMTVTQIFVHHNTIILCVSKLNLSKPIPTVCVSHSHIFIAYKNLSPILGNNQLEALFYIFIYYTSLHVSSNTVLIIRRSNCINTSSGMISLCKWLLDMPVLTGIPSSHLHRLIIPDDALIQWWCCDARNM